MPLVLPLLSRLDVVVQYLALQLTWNCTPCGRAARSQKGTALQADPDHSSVYRDMCVMVGCTAMHQTGCTSHSFPFVLFIILRILFSYWLLVPSLQLKRASRRRSRQLWQRGFSRTALTAFCSAETPYPKVQLEG